MATMTGVSCSADCVKEFEALKTKQAYQGLEFVIDGDTIVIGQKFDKGCSWDDFVAKVSEDARYYVWDFSFEDGGVKKSKILFISWNPDSGKVKTKMLYAGSKDALKKKIEGGLIEVQANGKDDLEEKDIEGRCKKGF
ncbi:Actophorin [Diplonema papillatum]|nr:Actophorin [Diplonema papillatum]KAJ9454554.1 Actophorin [Diplonema papillatum]|eukprot:gene22920-35128_t